MFRGDVGRCGDNERVLKRGGGGILGRCMREVQAAATSWRPQILTCVSINVHTFHVTVYTSAHATHTRHFIDFAMMMIQQRHKRHMSLVVAF